MAIYCEEWWMWGRVAKFSSLEKPDENYRWKFECNSRKIGYDELETESWLNENWMKLYNQARGMK